ncbi:MAG: hypothetical protein K6E50_13510 [Lachnospiraceae bacterium]|nr:hypothetical protein [Lachnospiraceae bacterium]
MEEKIRERCELLKKNRKAIADGFANEARQRPDPMPFREWEKFWHLREET